MADLDLLSYERDSRWMPHLSWAYPDWTLQQRMEAQVAQREQAFQKIADKLGPLLIGSNIGSSFGQSDFISRHLGEDDDYLARVYEKAPLLSTRPTNNQSCSQAYKSYQAQLQSSKLSQQSTFIPSQSDTHTPDHSPSESRSDTPPKSRSASWEPVTVSTEPVVSQKEERERQEQYQQQQQSTSSGSESGSSLRNASKIVKTICSGAAQSVWDFIYLLKSAFCASLQSEHSLA